MIFITILFAIIAVLGVVVPSAFAKGLDETNRYDKAKKVLCKRLKVLVPAVAIGLFVVITAVSGIQIVDQTEIGVVRTFGQISGSIQPGMNFVNPFTDTVTKYDTRVQSHELVFASYTLDGQAVDIVVELQFNVPREKVIEVASNYGSAETLITRILNSSEEKIKFVFAGRTAMQAVEQRSALSGDAQISVQSIEATYPIDIASVIIKDISFSDAFEASIELKVKAEQEKLTSKTQSEKAVLEAERDATIRRTQADANLYAAEKEAEAERLRADAEAYRINTEGEAIRANPDMLEQLRIEQWDGAYPDTYISGSAPDLILGK